MNELAGKVAIVTGASRGIGAAAANALAKGGAAVVLAARDGALSARVAEAIIANGGRAHGVACDVADYASVEGMLGETERQFGPVDILINNAGVIEPIAALAEGDPAAWARNIGINLAGGYHAIRAVLPGMLRAGGGTIVNLSSGAAHRPLEGWSAYCAAKAGLAMLTEALALETAGAGIRVFGLAPGVIDTDMQGVVRGTDEAQFMDVERFRRMKEAGELRSPAEVAEAILRAEKEGKLRGEPLADLRSLPGA